MYKKMKSRAITTLLVFVMVFGAMSVNVVAQASDTPEFVIIEGVIFLPLRATMEGLGATVEWDGENAAVIVTFDDEVLIICVRESGSFIENGRTWTPQDYLNVILIPILTPQVTSREVFRGDTDYYTAEPIIIGEGTDWPIDGILTMPREASAENPVPAVVLMAGSGPTDMDSYVAGNTPLLDIADYLSSNGIAVIRHDKRVVTHGLALFEAFGGYQTVYHEYIADALLAAEMLRADVRINSDQIFVLGHSQGGQIAPRVHLEGGDFAGIILMAAPPRCLIDLYIEQVSADIEIQLASVPEEFLDIATEQLATIKHILESLAVTSENLMDMTAAEAREYITALGAFAYYFWDMRQHSLDVTIPKIDAPFLVLQPERDFQVLADVDFILMKELLQGRDNVEFILYPNLNHLFVETTATNFTEHAADIVANPGRMNAQVLRDIVDWILGIIG